MTSSDRKELFISYGREPEVIQFVTRLKRDLESNGFSVWMDVHDIPAGSDWHGAIGTGLVHCRGIVPIITNKYIASRYCTNEVCTCTVVDHKWCRERERNTKCNTIGIQLVWWLLKSGTERNGSAY